MVAESALGVHPTIVGPVRKSRKIGLRDPSTEGPSATPVRLGEDGAGSSRNLRNHRSVHWRDKGRRRYGHWQDGTHRKKCCRPRVGGESHVMLKWNIMNAYHCIEEGTVTSVTL